MASLFTIVTLFLRQIFDNLVQPYCHTHYHIQMTQLAVHDVDKYVHIHVHTIHPVPRLTSKG